MAIQEYLDTAEKLRRMQEPQQPVVTASAKTYDDYVKQYDDYIKNQYSDYFMKSGGMGNFFLGAMMKGNPQVRQQLFGQYYPQAPQQTTPQMPQQVNPIQNAQQAPFLPDMLKYLPNYMPTNLFTPPMAGL